MVLPSISFYVALQRVQDRLTTSNVLYACSYIQNSLFMDCMLGAHTNSPAAKQALNCDGGDLNSTFKFEHTQHIAILFSTFALICKHALMLVVLLHFQKGSYSRIDHIGWDLAHSKVINGTCTSMSGQHVTRGL